MERIKSIVVVGGTVAGWTSAVRLGQVLNLPVTVVETLCGEPGPGLTGEVEALPARFAESVFEPLGLLPEDWAPACDAWYSSGVRHLGWRTDGPAASGRLRNGARDLFMLPADLELPEVAGFGLGHHWAWRRVAGETVEPYDTACFHEPVLVEAGRAPRRLDGRTAHRHGWHVDVRQLTACLRRIAVERLDVRAVRGTLRGVRRGAGGALMEVLLRGGRAVAGDLFLDCTADGALLAGELGEPRRHHGQWLAPDSGVVLTVPPSAVPDRDLSATTVFAEPAGWVWTMPLADRVGSGLVYSRALLSRQEAVERICSRWGLAPDTAGVRALPVRTGYSRRAWVANCVAMGPAAHHVEPLQPSGTEGVLAALDDLLERFPRSPLDEACADWFNARSLDRYTAARDFAQSLYAATARRTSPLWAAQLALAEPPTAAERSAAYREGLQPARGDSLHTALLSALGRTRRAPAVLDHMPGAVERARAHFARVARRRSTLLGTLPSTRASLARLYGDPRPAFPPG